MVIFTHDDGGPLSRVCARLTFRSAHHVPKPLRSLMQSFGKQGKLFRIPPICLPKKLIVWGEVGPRNILWGGILIFLGSELPLYIAMFVR